jgi:hypothetical protein
LFGKSGRRLAGADFILPQFPITSAPEPSSTASTAAALAPASASAATADATATAAAVAAAVAECKWAVCKPEPKIPHIPTPFEVKAAVTSAVLNAVFNKDSA